MPIDLTSLSSIDESSSFVIPNCLIYCNCLQFMELPTMASFSAQTPIITLPWLLLAILVGSICAIEEVNGSMKEANQREFDYFALALQWPGTYCRRSRQCCSTNACCRGSNAPTEFTIHGLWPDYNDGTWPSCCSGPYFDPKEISTLINALEQYWPSLSCGSPSTCHGTRGSFWAHEWEKHGTCSFPVIRDEYNFFLTGLNLYFKYNVTRVLNEAGYAPSNREKYPLGGIVTAIENAFHISPQVICSGDAVEEVRLCFYKDFKPRDCVVASDIRIDMVTSKSCPKYVSLPVHVSSGITKLPLPVKNDVMLACAGVHTMQILYSRIDVFNNPRR